MAEPLLANMTCLMGMCRTVVVQDLAGQEWPQMVPMLHIPGPGLPKPPSTAD